MVDINYNKILGYMLTRYNESVHIDEVNTKQFKDMLDLFLREYKNIEEISRSAN